MNGLIADDEAVQLEATNKALEPYNIVISEDEWINNCVGRKGSEFLREFMPKDYADTPSILNKVISEILNRKREYYRDLMKDQVLRLIMPGVIGLITYVSRSQKHTLALATSAPAVEVDVILGKDGLNLKNQFKFIINGEDVKKAKPDPEIYLKISELSGNENLLLGAIPDLKVGALRPSL
ncbi:hypothetical protein COT48_04645, partial [Candidatus Woesearchaeota archaeon CG08_land_8_20_14_0_20_47_9]